MKNIIKLLVTGAVLSVGVELGRKVWNEWLVGKVDKLKTKLTK